MTRYSCYVLVIPWFSTENPRVNQSLWPITKTQLTKESILDGQQCTWQALRAGNVHLRSLFVSGWEVARKFASSVVHCTHTWTSVRLLSGENGSKFLPTLKPSSGQFQSYHLEKVGQLSIFTRHHNGHFSACRKKMAAMFGSQIVPRGIDALLTLSLISPKMTAADQECKKPWVQLSNSSFLEPFGPLFLHFRLCKRQN